MVRGDPLDQERTIARAIAAGVNYFDTAVQYDPETKQHLYCGAAQSRQWHSAPCGYRDRGSALVAHDITVGKDPLATLTMYDRKAADRIAEIEGLLKQSMERLTKQMEAVTELQSRGADTTEALRLLEQMQWSCEEQIEFLENLLCQHEKKVGGLLAQRDRLQQGSRPLCS